MWVFSVVSETVRELMVVGECEIRGTVGKSSAHMCAITSVVMSVICKFV